MTAMLWLWLVIGGIFAGMLCEESDPDWLPLAVAVLWPAVATTLVVRGWKKRGGL